VPPFEDSYFEFSDRPVKLRGCDCPGCGLPGDYRAPKSRDQLDQYYWFCLDHVRDYNKQWDYFAGMSVHDIEEHVRKASVWERPSWPFSGAKAREQHIRDEVMREFFSDEMKTPPPTQAMSKAEREALLLLELTPPVSFAAIKAQYRILVKRHHPDANGGSEESEEKFKNINQAFTVLKQIYAMDEA
jgi:DnaJ-domain-containing protein 1